MREGADARELERDVLVIAAGGRHSPELWPELPIRPLCRQLVEVGPVAALPDDLPMVLEAETGFHFRRVARCCRLAMAEPAPRWSDARRGGRGARRGLARAGSRIASRPPPALRSSAPGRASTT